MAAHKSFRTSERLAPLAIISSVRFSAANKDSACDGLVVFGPCSDSDPAGRTTVAAPLSCISWIGLRRDSGEFFISIGHRASQAHHGRRSGPSASTTALISAACVLSYPQPGETSVRSRAGLRTHRTKMSVLSGLATVCALNVEDSEGCI